MLYCDLCDYCKTAQSRANGQSKCVCEITGFVFHKKPEEYDMENYPCYNYNLNANAGISDQEIVEAEKKLA